MAIIPILGNLIAGIAINFISGLLNPAKQAKINEDLPQLGSGSLCYCFGFTFSSTVLVAYTKASIAGHGQDKSTFTMLGLVNPTSLKILAFRHNNQVVKTKTSFFKLAEIEDVGKFVDPDGYQTLNDVNIYAQTNTNVPNPNFRILGYPEIQYQGLTWEQVNATKTSIIGGASAPASWIVQNGGVSASFLENGNGNNPISITIRGTRSDFFGFTQIFFNAEMPSGYLGCVFLRTFTWMNNPGVNRDSNLFAIGNNTEICLGGSFFLNAIDTPTVNSPYTPEPATPGSTIGRYYPNAQVGTAANLTGTTVTCLLASVLYQGIKEIIVPLSNTPLWGDGINVRNSAGAIIGTKLTTEKVVGWSTKVFTIDPANPDTGGQTITNFQPNNIPILAATNGQTTLVAIISGLMTAKGYSSLNDFTFSPLFDEPVIGFTTELSNVEDKINNLLVLYNKLVIETRDGVLKFLSYSELNAINAVKITHQDLLDPPKFTLSPEIDTPDALELSYRSSTRQFAESTIVVGTGTSNNKTGIRLDVVLNPIEANRLAWNALRLIKGTYLKATLMLPGTFNNIENGDIIDFYLPSEIGTVGSNPELLKLLVVSSAYGADRSIELECVNYLGVSPPIASTIPELITTNPAAIPPAAPAALFYIDAEPVPRQRETGGIFVRQLAGKIQQPTDVYTLDFGKDSPPGTMRPLDIFTLGADLRDVNYGTVTEIVVNGEIFSWGYQSIIVTLANRAMVLRGTNGLIRLGNSWVKYQSASFNDPSWTLTGITTGLYGSKPEVFPTDKAYQGYARSPWLGTSGPSITAHANTLPYTKLNDPEESPTPLTFRWKTFDTAINEVILPVTKIFGQTEPYRTTGAGSCIASVNGNTLMVSFTWPGSIVSTAVGATWLNNKVQPINETINLVERNREFEVVVAGTRVATFGTLAGIFHYEITVPAIARGTVVKVREYRLSDDGVPYYGTWENSFVC